VFDRPRTVVLEAGGLRVAFAGFPYARAVRARIPELLAAARCAEQQADLRVLCLHHCVEGATCSPHDYVFRTGEDVIRTADLVPGGFAMVLCGHVHRHQVLRPPGAPPIVYAGSVERTSFAEAEEVKGWVLLELDRDGARFEFHPLPARPMVILQLSLEGLSAETARQRLAEVIATTPGDAVVQFRLERWPPPAASWLTAGALRALAGKRNVSLRLPGQASAAPGGRASSSSR
jgi:DNA repair exonuclease SbcCD nuclease subunit